MSWRVESNRFRQADVFHVLNHESERRWALPLRLQQSLVRGFVQRKRKRAPDFTRRQ